MIDIKLKIRKMEDEKISKALNVAIDILTKLLEADEDSSEYENFSERYRPVKQEITKFDENSFDKKWLTQYHFGCLLFALLNGNFLDSNWKKYFDFNLDFSHLIGKSKTKKQIIMGVIHEYKAILLWILLTENNVVHGNFKYIRQMVHEMLESKSVKEICEIAKTLSRLYENNEKRFAERYEKNRSLKFEKGDWSILGRRAKVLDDITEKDKSLLTAKMRYLERLPRYSLFCLNDHWITFLGCKDDQMIFYDSYKPQKLKVKSKVIIATKVTAIFIK